MLELLDPTIINIDSSSVADISKAAAGLPVTFILAIVSSLAISMTLISVMVRIAPWIGMIDKPDPRKIHAVPIPRVGGVGIVLGALIPITLLVPLDQSMLAFIAGALVLFAFGVLDDCRELGHYVKFIGQFIAVITVVYFGDVFVTSLPFMGGEPIEESVGRPFTVFAMVGMINAINHSDGLDGLAGGESLLSLVCIAWLAYVADGETVMVITISVIGGLFGFMRFNTYPARIFMGDGGSQFLGYVLGFLVVVLTQNVNPTLSPALPALVLGLPIADIIAVFAQRIYKKMNWFRASRNHIHHRLLDLGFNHFESVLLVYSVQALLILFAVLMPYESDALIIGVYLTVVIIVFVSLYVAERASWDRREHGIKIHAGSVAEPKRLAAVSFYLVYYGIVLFLVSGAVLATDVPTDFSLIAAILFALLLVQLVAGYRIGFLSPRFLAFVTIAFIVYLLNTYQPDYMSGTDPITYGFFGILVAGIAVSIRFSDEDVFNVTPMDYLIIMVLLVLAVLASNKIVDVRITAIILKVIVLFYGSELIIGKMTSRWNLFTLAVLVSLLIVCVRGLLLHGIS